MKYYIWDTRSVVGNCILWWRKESCGYTCNLDDAGQYDEDEAFRIERNRGTDVAVPVDMVQANKVTHVRADSVAMSDARQVALARIAKREEESRKARGL